MRPGNPDTRHPWEEDIKLHIDLGFIPPSVAVMVMEEMAQTRVDDAKPNAARRARVAAYILSRVRGTMWSDELEMRSKDAKHPFQLAKEDKQRQDEQRAKMLPGIKRASTQTRSYAGPAVRKKRPDV